MCGRPYAVDRRGVSRKKRTGGASAGFFGLDVEDMPPGARIAVAISVLALGVLGAFTVLLLVPELFWLVFTFGWIIFPALGLLVESLAETGTASPERLPAHSGERELLDALRAHGELTPVRAAMETSLSVAEAERMLRDLARGGHLEVRARGGTLSYSMWETESRDAETAGQWRQRRGL